MKALGLDCATRTGWAISGGPSGVIDLRCHSGDHPAILGQFGRHVADLIIEHKPDIVMVERPHLRGGGSILLCGLHGVALQIAWLHERTALSMRTGYLKAWATGAGNADKPAMLVAARRYEPGLPEDFDRADARLLAEMAALEAGIAA